MRTRILFLAMVCMLVALMPTRASAEVKSFDCGPGSYLIGFKANAGAYVDHIAGVCAPWRPDIRRRGAPVDGPVFGLSQGGRPQEAICRGDMAVVKVEYVLPNINGNDVMERLALTCQGLRPPHSGITVHPAIHTDGEALNDFRGFWHDSSARLICGPAEVATGFDADVAQYVGLMNLHCGAWPESAAAPAAPPLPNVDGSWKGSCSKGSVQGTVLTATCLNFGGAPVDSSLDLNTCARPETAGNENGKLVCESGPRPPPIKSLGKHAAVPGSWVASCSNGSLQDHVVLTTNCVSASGAKISTSLDLRSCGQPARAGNNDGRLVCESGARVLPVGGSWAASCLNETMAGSVLTAACVTVTGTTVVSSLDLRTCKQPATAGNRNGRLVCESGLADAGGGSGSGGGGGGSGSGGSGGGRPPREAPQPGAPQKQALSITCASTSGEICMTPGFVTFMADGAPGTWTVTLTAPTTHCSSVIYNATGPSPENMSGSTGQLAAGRSHDIDIGKDLPAGRQSIRIVAVGVRGGCNSGTISSWGVEAAVYRH